MSIAVDGGNVYVGKASKVHRAYTGEVVVLDMDLNYLSSLGSGAGEFMYPSAIAVGSGNVFVADKEAGTAKAYSAADGTFQFSFGPEAIVKPVRVAVPPATGHLYVADHNIDNTAPDSTTTVSTPWGDRIVPMDTIPGYGSGLAVFDGTDGSFMGRFPIIYGFDKTQDYEMVVPSGVSIDYQDRVYVTDAGFGFTKVFDGSGNFICNVADTGGAVYPQAPAFTTDGRYIISTNHGIKSYSTDDFVDMGVAPAELDYVTQECAQEALASQVVTVSNGGDGSMDWTAASDSAWLSVDTTSGTIEGVGTADITISVDASAGGYGSQTGSITISSKAGTKVVQVTLLKYDAPTLSVDLSGAPYDFLVTGSNSPSSKTLTVSVDGYMTGTLGWTMASSDAWVSVAPSSGTSSSSALAYIGIDAAALAGVSSGNFTGEVVVSSECASMADVTVPVSLEYYEGGTIVVGANNPMAAFTISGPASYSGSGVSKTFYDVPSGLYTINFTDVQGYITPASYSTELFGDETIAFAGIYADLREDNDIITTMGGSDGGKADDVANVFDGDGTGLSSFIIGKASRSGRGAGGAASGSFTAASGDLDGDGVDEIVVVSDGAIKGFAGTGEAIAGLRFKAFTEGTAQDVVMGDLDGDGVDEIIVGSGTTRGDSAVIRAFGFVGGAVVDTGVHFKAYADTSGVFIATGDVDGDGADEILTTRAGSGGREVYIRIWDVSVSGGEWIVTAAGEIAAGVSFEAADITAGECFVSVYFSSGDLDGDGVDEIMISMLAGRSDKSSSVVAYTMGGSEVLSFQGPATGIRLAAGDIDMDGEAEIVVSEGTARTSSTTISVYGSDGTFQSEFSAYNEDDNIYGASVAVGQTRAAR